MNTRGGKRDKEYGTRKIEGKGQRGRGGRIQRERGGVSGQRGGGERRSRGQGGTREKCGRGREGMREREMGESSRITSAEFRVAICAQPSPTFVTHAHVRVATFFFLCLPPSPLSAQRNTTQEGERNVVRSVTFFSPLPSVNIEL